jgi:hypothetical protein
MDYSIYLNEETLKEWNSVKLDQFNRPPDYTIGYIRKINFKKLIELYGKPNIDIIYFRRLLDPKRYSSFINDKQTSEYSVNINKSYFNQSYIHWNIFDENKQLIAIIYIEYYYGDANYFHITNHQVEFRYQEFDWFLNKIIKKNVYKQKLIEDFVQQKRLKKEDYPGIKHYCDMNFEPNFEPYCRKGFDEIEWFIDVKNEETFKKLSLLLEFEEVPYNYGDDD